MSVNRNTRLLTSPFHVVLRGPLPFNIIMPPTDNTKVSSVWHWTELTSPCRELAATPSSPILTLWSWRTATGKGWGRNMEWRAWRGWGGGGAERSQNIEYCMQYAVRYRKNKVCVCVLGGELGICKEKSVLRGLWSESGDGQMECEKKKNQINLKQGWLQAF